MSTALRGMLRGVNPFPGSRVPGLLVAGSTLVLASNKATHSSLGTTVIPLHCVERLLDDIWTTSFEGPEESGGESTNPSEQISVAQSTNRIRFSRWLYSIPGIGTYQSLGAWTQRRHQGSIVRVAVPRG